MDCGTVVGKIYEYDYLHEHEGQQTLRSSARYHRFRGLSKTTVEYLRISESLKNNKRLQKRGKIDSSRFFRYIKGEIGRVKLIKVDPVSSSIKEDTRVKEIMKVMSKYPRLNSRTDRGRVALALITLYLLKNYNIRISKVAQLTGLSRMQVRRLIKALGANRKFIEDAKEKLSAMSYTL